MEYLQLLIVLLPAISNVFGNRKMPGRKSVKKTLFGLNRLEKFKKLTVFYAFLIISLLIMQKHIDFSIPTYSTYILVTFFIVIILLIEVDKVKTKYIYRIGKIGINLIYLVLILIIVLTFNTLLISYFETTEYNAAPKIIKEIVLAIIGLMYFVLSGFYYNIAEKTMNIFFQPTINFIVYHNYRKRVRKVKCDDVLIDDKNYYLIKYTEFDSSKIDNVVIIPINNMIKIESMSVKTINRRDR